jgi:regulator of replication initiation timing
MLSLQRLSDNLCSFSKKIDELISQKKELQKENKHLRKKLKKMATRV